MVFLAENLNLRLASICMLLVMNGGAGCRFFLFLLTSETANSDPLSSLQILSAVSLSLTRCFLAGAFLPSIFSRLATNCGGFSPRRSVAMVQYSSGLKALMAWSLSQIILTATD